MSYGLFNEVMRVVPDPTKIDQLLVTDPYLRDFIIRRMLTGNKKVMGEEDLVDPFELDIDMDRIDELVGWVAEHILSFFAKSAVRTAETATKYKPVLTQLNQSLVGSEI
jgi:hypothetical protein